MKREGRGLYEREGERVIWGGEGKSYMRKKRRGLYGGGGGSYMRRGEEGAI